MKLLLTVTLTSHGKLFHIWANFAAESCKFLPSVAVAEEFLLQRVERRLLIVDSLDQREGGIDGAVNVHWIRRWPEIAKSFKSKLLSSFWASFELTLDMELACEDKRIEIFSKMRAWNRGINLHMLDHWHFNVADDFDGVRLRPRWKSFSMILEKFLLWFLRSYTGRSTGTCLITGYGAGTCLMTSTGYGCGTRTSTGTVLQKGSRIVH